METVMLLGVAAVGVGADADGVLGDPPPQLAITTTATASPTVKREEVRILLFLQN
jgi:hypothetical protein